MGSRRIFYLITTILNLLASNLAMTTPLVTRLLARKCCSSWEQLQANYSCTPLEGSVVRRVTQETVVAAMSAGGDSALHWMPEALRLATEGGAPWSVQYNGQVPCKARDRLMLRSDDTRRYRLESNGTLVLISPTAAGGILFRRFSPNQYCLDTIEESKEYPKGQHVFQLCPCDATHLCVRKCCPRGMAMRAGSRLRCEPTASGESWSPFRWKNTNEPPNSFPNVSFEILEARPPECASETIVKNPETEPYHILEAWFSHPHGKIFQPDGVCSDLSFPEGEPGDPPATAGITLAPNVGLCPRSVPFVDYEEVGGGVHAAAAVLLLVALVAQLALPERRASAHERSLAAHALALLCTNVLLAVWFDSNGTIGDCAVMPFVIYFFMTCSGFWLNVIAINMARSFRHPEEALSPGGVRRGWRRFAWGLVWAVGGAGALTAAAAATWHAPALPWWLPRPSLHETRICYHDITHATKWGTFVYFFGPMAVLLVVNSGLLIYTVVRIRNLDKFNAMVTKESHITNRPPKGAVLYVTLLACAGVCELAAEMVAWASGGGGSALAEGAFLAATDALDLARAVAVFALCVWQRRVREALADCADACCAWLSCSRADVGCCGGKVSPAGAEWRYVVGGAPAPVAGSEERRRKQQRRTRHLDERPVIELWAVRSPKSSTDESPTSLATPTFPSTLPAEENPTSTL